MSEVAETLAVREQTHGHFEDTAATAQFLKCEWRGFEAWSRMDLDQQEALDMIATKLARLLNGNPNEPDTWHDIAGYATLVERRLKS